VLTITKAPSSSWLSKEKNPAREIWDGERLGIAKALQTLGANQACPINKLKAQLPLLIKEANTNNLIFKQTSQPYFGLLHRQLMSLYRNISSLLH
jgi:hypothetical protein